MSAMVYDVEVLRGPDEVEGGWQNPEAMGFGSAVVYSYSEDRYYFFPSSGKAELIQLLQNNKVVSFNGVKFDNAVVLGNDYGEHEHRWLDVDLLLQVVKHKFGLATVGDAEEKLGDKEIHDGSISLDGLAEGTLDKHKTGHGAHAPKLIREAKWAELYSYNLQDVRLTKMLYDFLIEYGYLIDRKGNKVSV